MTTTPTLWQSIKNSRKAIVAGLIALATFIAVTLQTHPGQNLTVRQWLEAAALYVVAHSATYLVGNEGTVPVTQVVAALVAHPTVTTALAALGVVDAPATVEPVPLPPVVVNLPPLGLAPAPVPEAAIPTPQTPVQGLAPIPTTSLAFNIPSRDPITPPPADNPQDMHGLT